MNWILMMLAMAGLCVFAAEAQFRVPPYVQYPRPDAMTLIWFSDDAQPGVVEIKSEDGKTVVGKGESNAAAMKNLIYTPWEAEKFFDGNAPPTPYRHVMNLKGLSPRTTYRYKVKQGDAEFESQFTTAPDGDAPVRFMVYADCETEPESTGRPVRWINAAAPKNFRRYPVDQTTGYAMNLRIMRRQKPDFVVIAGDIVETGGEQRDWDEFWRHNTDLNPKRSFAGSIPIMPVLGNHDYFAGNHGGEWHRGYGGAKDPIFRLLAYFHVPDNNVKPRTYRGRFYHFMYGPVSLIAIDSNNAPQHRSEQDTNFGLVSRAEGGRRIAPSFLPGSQQYQWLEEQLTAARKASRFVFVTFHHTPYSSGPHGRNPGIGEGLDTLSSVPAQVLTPLFHKHRVDAVFGGHDEMFERSEVVDPKTGHVLHFYDVGVGGDGLRPPHKDARNPHQRFIAHHNAPEMWEDGHLVKGGKHYGHLEVNVDKDGNDWQAVLTPVYVLPVFDKETKKLKAFRRMTYDDTVTIKSIGEGK